MERNTIKTYRDDFGIWYATVEFPHTMSESDPREEFNLNVHWDAIRSSARRAIKRQAMRYDSADSEWRCNVEVYAQGVYGDNTWYSVTFRESI